MDTIKLTIQEIVKDFYSLADMEGYLSCKAECFELNEEDKLQYLHLMEKLIQKYIPTYKKHLSDGYETLDTHDKGLELSSMLDENFREIFYKLV